MAKLEKLYKLSLAEVELMKASESDPNLWARYWLQKEGQDRPFQFDYNFTEEGKWQVDAIMAKQEGVLAICGISAGKTLAVGLGACFHATITQEFEFYNIGKDLDQARIMYDLILKYAKNTRLEKLISGSPSSPHPKINFNFYVGNILFSSVMHFYSAGELSDASNLFSQRGDWFNIEEAWRFDDLSTLIMRLTTRGTGATASGRPFMGRLSIISNPLDNPQLWALFDNAKADPEHWAVFLIDSEQNLNNTPEQIATQLRNIPEEERGFYLTGKRPEGRGSYFSRTVVESCESESLAAQLREGIAAGVPGFHGESHPAMGYWHYRFPRDPMHTYIITTDPGTGAAPSRNAPVIMVHDVTNAPKVNVVSALWWGNGGGSIMPWVNHLLEFMKIYQPVFVGVDSTSTQKYSAELFNVQYVTGNNYSVERINGLDFSGSGKYSYLVSARLAISANLWFWPITATGIGSQFKSYDPILDNSKSAKIPQDLVATLAMGCYVSRALYPSLEEEDAAKSTGSVQRLPYSSRGSVARSTNRAKNTR